MFGIGFSKLFYLGVIGVVGVTLATVFIVYMRIPPVGCDSPPTGFFGGGAEYCGFKAAAAAAPPDNTATTCGGVSTYPTKQYRQH